MAVYTIDGKYVDTVYDGSIVRVKKDCVIFNSYTEPGDLALSDFYLRLDKPDILVLGECEDGDILIESGVLEESFHISPQCIEVVSLGKTGLQQDIDDTEKKLERLKNHLKELEDAEDAEDE